LPKAVRAFPFDIPAIYLALEVFTAMVVGTGIGDLVAIKLAKASRGRKIVTAALSVLVLLATCVLGNNLSHVGIIVPVLLVLLSTLAVDRRYIVGYFALVMAIVNLAGAATPVGDFPALTIMASGITNFGSYLSLAFPLFGVVTAGTLLGVYALIFRRSRQGTDSSALPPEAGAVLLRARLRSVKVDRVSLGILAVILAGMFAGWVFLPTVPPWAIAWAGTGLAAVVAHRVRGAIKLEATDLFPVLKISVFLGMASFIATTGVLQSIASQLQRIHDPRLLIVALMVTVAAITAVVSAGPTAAVLLPIAQALVVPGAVLAGMGNIVAVAFAGAICAGSSVFLISATAGPLLAKKVKNAELLDERGVPVDFSARAYLPYGLLNGGIQLTVAIIAVLGISTIWGAR
jgi:Na+/H+ antiporter NhaD/arsenite permease-like protein